jgi:HSP20 family protein
MANGLQERHTAPALENVRREFDELIDRFLEGTPRSMQRLNALLNEPGIESYIEGDKMVVRAEMPGMDPKDIEVTVTGNMLTIRGSREEQHEEKGRDFRQREISYEKMERSIMLPPGTTGEGIKASYKNGILELTVPIPKEASTKKIQVQSADGGSGSKA